MINTSLSVVITDEDIESTIETMGMTKDILHRAISEGIYEYRNVSKLHPLNAGGSRAWAEIIASFREQLLQTDNGWGFEHRNGLTLTINRELSLNVVVTSGDKDTGLIAGYPKTKNAKGNATRDFIGVNYDLFEHESDSTVHSFKIDRTETWVLLYHIDNGKKEVRFELSLPKGMAGDNESIRICSWLKRIVFEPIPFDQVVTNIDKPEFNDDIEFELTKKS